jgi:hypothetical protein
MTSETAPSLFSILSYASPILPSTRTEPPEREVLLLSLPTSARHEDLSQEPALLLRRHTVDV